MGDRGWGSKQLPSRGNVETPPPGRSPNNCSRDVGVTKAVAGPVSPEGWEEGRALVYLAWPIPARCKA